MTPGRAPGSLGGMPDPSADAMPARPTGARRGRVSWVFRGGDARRALRLRDDLGAASVDALVGGVAAVVRRRARLLVLRAGVHRRRHAGEDGRAVGRARGLAAVAAAAV